VFTGEPRGVSHVLWLIFASTDDSRRRTSKS
jgi:hypothetical protein